MSLDVPVPHLTTAHCGPLHPLEEVLLNNVARIETWFRKQWSLTPPAITSSVDLRHSGMKLAPVDTNLFPAGFNNINADFLPLCIQAAQAVLANCLPSCTRILLIPENHTRNPFYLQSLAVLRDILIKAGFVVRLGNVDLTVDAVVALTVSSGETLFIEPLVCVGDRIGVVDFDPCIIVLNNDLSSGIPDVLQGISQPVMPPAQLGWARRLKSSHFKFYHQIALEFSTLLNVDDWLINPYFKAVDGVDFMEMKGIDVLCEAVDSILLSIQEKYKQYGINERPFVVVKADNGTYGMGVMSIYDSSDIRTLNRKKRTKMSVSKGSQAINRVLVQEGVYTFETMPDGAVAEPVVYMLGQFVVGGFYRVHQGRGKDENLNAPGMHFEPLAFASPCNTPRNDLSANDCPNRFYAYGVISRLAALAAAREIAALTGDNV